MTLCRFQFRDALVTHRKAFLPIFESADELRCSRFTIGVAVVTISNELDERRGLEIVEVDVRERRVVRGDAFERRFDAFGAWRMAVTAVPMEKSTDAPEG